MAKIMSIRLAGPDDPIYRESLQGYRRIGPRGFDGISTGNG
jgi:hypothetical protein